MTLGNLLYTMHVKGPVALVRDVSLGYDTLPEIYYDEFGDVEGCIEESNPELLGYDVYGICIGNNRNINEMYLEIALLDWEGKE